MIRKIGQRSPQLIRGIWIPSVWSRKYQTPISRITSPTMIEATFAPLCFGGRQALDGEDGGGGGDEGEASVKADIVESVAATRARIAAPEETGRSARG